MALKQMFTRFSDQVKPRIERAKRVIFMTSLYLQMVRDHNPSKESLEDVNKRFRLVMDSDKLVLPAVLRGLIWKNEQVNALVEKEISKGDITGACATVVAVTPKWLRYGASTDAMIRDAREVAQSASRIAVMH